MGRGFSDDWLRWGLARAQADETAGGWHLAPEVLSAWVGDRLSPAERRRTTAHMAECQSCRTAAMDSALAPQPTREAIFQRRGSVRRLPVWMGATAAAGLGVALILTLRVVGPTPTKGFKQAARIQPTASVAPRIVAPTVSPRQSQPSTSQLTGESGLRTPGARSGEQSSLATSRLAHDGGAEIVRRPHQSVARSAPPAKPEPALATTRSEVATVPASGSSVGFQEQVRTGRAASSARLPLAASAVPAFRETPGRGQTPTGEFQTAGAGLPSPAPAVRASLGTAPPAFGPSEPMPSLALPAQLVPIAQQPASALPIGTHRFAIHLSLPSLPGFGRARTPAPSALTSIAVAPWAPEDQPAVPANWRITPDGRLQKSSDGRNWLAAMLPAGALAQAVTAVGSRVWAAAERAAIFFSSDGGGHWSRLASVPVAGPQVTVRAMVFDDPMHGSLLTSTGQTWVSADGGHHWQPQHP